MCARFTLKTSAAVIERLFEVDDLPQIGPRYNIAPSQAVVGVVEDQGVRVARLFQWGLVPSWAKDRTIGARLINARSETVSEKPAFRGAFRYRRCLIPADGYYEWRSEEVPTVSPRSALPVQLDLFGGGPDEPVGETPPPARTVRQPYWVHLDGDRPFAFAGLWECWTGDDGSALETCTILTTESSERIRGLHDRMPVILTPDSWHAWLDVRANPAASVQGLLRPYEGDDLRATRVSTRVNRVRYDDTDCVTPI
ncbi:MAG: SOS response-associated peptidase [Fimbriimonadaceae bacterium]